MSMGLFFWGKKIILVDDQNLELWQKSKPTLGFVIIVDTFGMFDPLIISFCYLYCCIWYVCSLDYNLWSGYCSTMMMNWWLVILAERIWEKDVGIKFYKPQLFWIFSKQQGTGLINK